MDAKLHPSRLDPRTDTGHVHLRVADLDRALAFCRGVLGFELTGRLGDQAAFLSAGGCHHHIGLIMWESRGRLAEDGGYAMVVDALDLDDLLAAANEGV